MSPMIVEGSMTSFLWHSLPGREQLPGGRDSPLGERLV